MVLAACIRALLVLVGIPSSRGARHLNERSGTGRATRASALMYRAQCSTRDARPPSDTPAVLSRGICQRCSWECRAPGPCSVIHPPLWREAGAWEDRARLCQQAHPAVAPVAIRDVEEDQAAYVHAPC